MTDGYHSWNVPSKADEVRAMSIKIIAIAIGEGVSLGGLEQLAGDNGKVLNIKNYTALASVMNCLVKFFCKHTTYMLFNIT